MIPGYWATSGDIDAANYRSNGVLDFGRTDDEKSKLFVYENIVSISSASSIHPSSACVCVHLPPRRSHKLK
jgi:hypothetical protein